MPAGSRKYSDPKSPSFNGGNVTRPEGSVQPKPTKPKKKRATKKK